jgi:hypothetical protein
VPEETPRCAIGIDCAPGKPRPDSYFAKILRGTLLQLSDFKSPDKFFGAWTWYLKADPQKEALFLVTRSTLRERLATTKNILQHGCYFACRHTKSQLPPELD